MPNLGSSVVVGRFAPSPTGSLHLGNLRTAIAAEQLARDVGGKFVIRMEDLDRVNASRSIATQQLRDLAEVGVLSDADVIWQSDRFNIYSEYLNVLTESELTYECFCTRKEIAQAVSAPHGSSGAYPGICRDLSESEKRTMRRLRSAAIRLRSHGTETTETDAIQDIVLWRNDGIPAYNLAVVVDDELQGVNQVARGDDLRFITPSQNHLQRLLSFRIPDYIHLPLMIGPDGNRLAKRHGAVSLAEVMALGFSAVEIRTALLNSLEAASHGWGESSNVSSWLRSLL